MKDFEQLFHDFKDALTSSERIRMRNELVAYIAEHPVRKRVPLWERAGVAVTGVFTSHSSARIAVSACALVLVVGVGTTYASESSLPGDPLYGVKVSFAEPIQGLFATSNVAKAEWNADRLDTRIAEAETLAAHGKLNEPTRAIVEAQIKSAVTDVSNSVAALNASEPVAAASVQSDVEASLMAHESVLATISSQVPDVASEVAPILAMVHTQTDSAHAARVAVADRILASKNRDTIAAAASTSKVAAAAKLNTARTLVSTVAKDDGENVAVAASTSADEVQAAIATGDHELERGEYDRAFGTFQAAARAARAITVHLDIGSKLGLFENDHASSTEATSTDATSTTTEAE